jgi:hypothetical protein
MKYILPFLLFFVLNQESKAQKKNVLTQLLTANREYFDFILKNPSDYEVQIIYTQIDRDKNNSPTFKSYTFNADSTHYFYPASTVKMALSFLTLERINHLKRTIPSFSKDTPYRMDSLRAMQIPFSSNPQSSNALPSLGQDIKEIMIVSDNFAYNHLFDFLGRDYINLKLKEKGYTNSRVMHRFSIPGIDNRFTAPMFFGEKNNTILLSQGEQVSVNQYVNQQKNLFKGKGYWDSKDSLINMPFDFSGKNYFSLHDQQLMLKAVLFPESVAPKNRFDLTAEDYQFLYKYMSILPRESRFPTYDTSYYDGFCKFLMWGDGKENRSSNIRIFNKVGDAYGYMIDNAYIVDFDKNIEFMLSAVILSNKDQIFNDGKYEYDTVGMPFFGELGRIIYQFEEKRKRQYQPNLSKFKLKY